MVKLRPVSTAYRLSQTASHRVLTIMVCTTGISRDGTVRQMYSVTFARDTGFTIVFFVGGISQYCEYSANSFW